MATAYMESETENFLAFVPKKNRTFAHQKSNKLITKK
jgi:hypothetical protein